jgi:putative transposase
MYRWRKMTAEECKVVLAHRKQLQRPWHTPPHPLGGAGEYHLTAACYEHTPVIGLSPERMDAFAAQLLETLVDVDVKAWCLLPNHYHLFIKVEDLRAALSTLGRLHGRTSFDWNGSDRPPHSPTPVPVLTVSGAADAKANS